MMTVVEFFFTNFWHWLGLVILVHAFTPIAIVRKNKTVNSVDPRGLM